MIGYKIPNYQIKFSLLKRIEWRKISNGNITWNNKQPARTHIYTSIFGLKIKKKIMKRLVTDWIIALLIWIDFVVRAIMRDISNEFFFFHIEPFIHSFTATRKAIENTGMYLRLASSFVEWKKNTNYNMKAQQRWVFKSIVWYLLYV